MFFACWCMYEQTEDFFLFFFFVWRKHLKNTHEFTQLINPTLADQIPKQIFFSIFFLLLFTELGSTWKLVRSISIFLLFLIFSSPRKFLFGTIDDVAAQRSATQNHRLHKFTWNKFVFFFVSSKNSIFFPSNLIYCLSFRRFAQLATGDRVAPTKFFFQFFFSSFSTSLCRGEGTRFNFFVVSIQLKNFTWERVFTDIRHTVVRLSLRES